MSFIATIDHEGNAEASWYRFENCGDRLFSGADPGWTATVDGTTVTLRYPLATFDAAGRTYLAEGGRLLRWWGVSSFVSNALDVTLEGPDFVIGSDMPADVPCTMDCP